MKVTLMTTILLAGSMSFAAIQVKCLVESEQKYSSNVDESSYQSSSIAKSLPEGSVTGHIDLGSIQDRKVSAEIHANGSGSSYIGSICAEDAAGAVCSESNGTLVISSSEEKTSISCQVK
jgi:hypothetical protein